MAISGDVVGAVASLRYHPSMRLCSRLVVSRMGFTLIELLVVMAILASIASMLMVLMSIAQRQARIANTKSMLMKADQAIRLFRADMRVYPWQGDLGTPPAEPTDWGNQLGYRLAWDPPATSGDPSDPDQLTYLTGFHADLAALRARFAFVNGKNVPPRGTATEGTHAFRNEEPGSGYRTNLLITAGSVHRLLSDITGSKDWFLPGTDTSPSTFYDGANTAQVLTRMAEEITELRYIAGQLPTEAPAGSDPANPADLALHPEEDPRYPTITWSATLGPYGYVPYNQQGVYGDDRRGPAMTAAAAAARGWRGEYLAGALRSVAGEPAAGMRGESLLDAWGRPLIYVCAVSPGSMGHLPVLGGHDRAADTDERRYNMGPQGRQAVTTRASDVRTTAAAAFALEFELWSAGPDGQFAAQRDAAVNRDNIAVLPYMRGLE
jgi:prepilin-type N-terminal cleavage/methylation domain-containing protein